METRKSFYFFPPCHIANNWKYCTPRDGSLDLSGFVCQCTKDIARISSLYTEFAMRLMFDGYFATKLLLLLNSFVHDDDQIKKFRNITFEIQSKAYEWWGECLIKAFWRKFEKKNSFKICNFIINLTNKHLEHLWVLWFRINI